MGLQFCRAIIDGGQIDKMFDRNGNKLTDRYLVRQLKEVIPTVEIVYEKTSGFVHLSGSHVFGTVNTVSEDGVVSFLIGATMPGISKENWTELIGAFRHFTQAILGLILRWGEIKKEGLGGV